MLARTRNTRCISAMTCFGLAMACFALLVCQDATAMGVLWGPFGTADQSRMVKCWIDRVSYDQNWYNANGHCQEIAVRDKAPRNVIANVPWSAVGRYDPQTREAFESLRIVQGGLDVPTHDIYGTIESKLVCGQDPWLTAVQDCGTVSVTTTERISQTEVYQLVQGRRRPFTSDLTSDQRAEVQREYRAAIDRLHQMVAVHPGTEVQPNSESTSTMSAHAPGGGTPITTTTGNAVPRATLPGSMLVVTQGSSASGVPMPDLVEPAAGAAVKQGQLRVRIRDAGSANGAASAMATVELVSMPARPTSPNAVQPSAPTNQTRTAQVAVSDLVRGVTLARDVSGGWTGPTLVRVRFGPSAPWSNGVSVTLVSDVESQARTAMPNWGSVQPSGTGTNAINNLRPSTVGASSGGSAPPSSLGGR